MKPSDWLKWEEIMRQTAEDGPTDQELEASASYYDVRTNLRAGIVCPSTYTPGKFRGKPVCNYGC